MVRSEVDRRHAANRGVRLALGPASNRPPQRRCAGAAGPICGQCRRHEDQRTDKLRAGAFRARVPPVTAWTAAIALSVWWTSNTIAHQFVHRAFFRRRWANVLCAAAMSGVSGIPQALWRDRHLAHHAGLPPRLRLTRELAAHVLVVGGTWSILLHQAPAFFTFTYLPGYACGLLLCALHGYYEHRGGTTSHYSTLYNALTFNDGYHVEHHAHPALPWRQLPAHRDPGSRASRWPAPLRWLELVDCSARRGAPTLRALAQLELLVLRSPMLQRFVLRTHSRALAGLLASLPPAREVAIVGGGLYP